MLAPPHGITKHTESPTLARAQSPVTIRILPPDASMDDESEVGELLREAARLHPDTCVVRTMQLVYASIDVIH